MPKKEPFNPEDVKKTASLFAFSNLLMSPFFHRLGPVASLLVIGAGLYGLHEAGRPKQSSPWPWFFPNQPKGESPTASGVARTIFVGGGLTFDRLIDQGKNNSP